MTCQVTCNYRKRFTHASDLHVFFLSASAALHPCMYQSCYVIRILIFFLFRDADRRLYVVLSLQIPFPSLDCRLLGRSRNVPVELPQVIQL